MSLRNSEQILNLWELVSWKVTVLFLYVCLGSITGDQITDLIDHPFLISILVSPQVSLTRDQTDYL